MGGLAVAHFPNAACCPSEVWIAVMQCAATTHSGVMVKHTRKHEQ